MRGAIDKKKVIQWLVLAAYLVMIAVNGLADYLPINGVTTAQVSASYSNLITPAGVTFSIWGLIYVLLLFFVLFQCGLMRTDSRALRSGLYSRVGLLFIISSIANAGWIWSWHNYLILLSLIFIAVILFSLILITKEIRKIPLLRKEIFFLKMPFNIYLGWITMATIANANVWLISLNWGRFGWSEEVWAVVVFMLGLALGLYVMIRNHDTAFGLAYLWAYLGILIKHVSPDGFGLQYPAALLTAASCVIILMVCETYLFFWWRRGNREPQI